MSTGDGDVDQDGYQGMTVNCYTNGMSRGDGDVDQDGHQGMTVNCYSNVNEITVFCYLIKNNCN